MTDAKHEPDLTPAGELVTARRLVRTARQATLATERDGQPHAALVTPACTAEMDLLLLLSTLSRHTAHLRENPRCALLCAAPHASLVNPQTIERINLTCHAAPDPSAPARARYLAIHPYAALYAGFTDFSLWRLTIERADYVGGFARAHGFAGAELSPEPAITAMLAQSEAPVVAHCNEDHAAAMEALGRAHTGVAAPWRLIGIDADGCDLACPEGSLWLPWTVSVRVRADLRHAIVALVQQVT